MQNNDDELFDESYCTAIALNTFSSLDMTYTSCISPFPAVFVLQNARVHIHSMNSGN